LSAALSRPVRWVVVSSAKSFQVVGGVRSTITAALYVVNIDGGGRAAVLGASEAGL
jgi:hypothetical protein